MGERIFGTSLMLIVIIFLIVMLNFMQDNKKENVSVHNILHRESQYPFYADQYYEIISVKKDSVGVVRLQRVNDSNGFGPNREDKVEWWIDKKDFEKQNLILLKENN